MNFQDVIREVYDSSQKALKTTASLSAATVYVGNPTLYAVVNTGAAGDSVANIGFATVSVSNPTLYAVVNTSASSGLATVDIRNTVAVTAGAGVTVFQGGTWTVTQASAARTITGNVTLSDAKTYIGLVTVTQASSARTITGNITLSDPKTYIGLVTVTQASSARTITGNITLSDAKTYIGLTTATIGSGIGNIGFATVSVSNPTLFAVVNTGAAGVQNSMVTVNAGPNQIGSVTVSNTVPVTGTFWQATQPVSGNIGVLGNVTLSPSINSIGFATVNVAGIAAGVNYIGLASVNVSNIARTITGNVTLTNPNTYIGLTTSTLGAGTTFIGLVTANSRNAGTTKTLIPIPFGFALTSVTTIAVPSNTFKITQFLASANATVGVSIKSGATYLVGNASIRVALAPNGGWVENGSVDSPVYVGLAGAAAIVIEKNDATTALAGKVIYFDE